MKSPLLNHQRGAGQVGCTLADLHSACREMVKEVKERACDGRWSTSGPGHASGLGRTIRAGKVPGSALPKSSTARRRMSGSEGSERERGWPAVVGSEKSVPSDPPSTPRDREAGSQFEDITGNSPPLR